ncbi:MAG TPA: glycosyltransferase family 4 protein [Candidatus Eisenbacteria bacterium]|jgi:glycosyltransferase involved in cell wall biosynthesis|nr:glycosyltransferase family 4 protein [Candidatus Eisenbacteria bacterium]
MAAAFVEPLAARHDVTIVCGRPSYHPTERRPWHLWQQERTNNVRVIRVGSTDYPRTQMARRVLNYLSYVALCVPRALFVPCDVVLAMTDPPFQGIVGAFVALLKRKPYVYNIRDMYPDMAVGGSLVAPGLLERIWELLHRWALRRATRVIVLGDDMRARIVAKGIPSERISTVRDGTELAPVDAAAPPAAVDPDVVRAIRGGFKFVLLHAGNLGFYGGWSTLLSGARQLAPDGVSLVFVGDGAQRAQLEREAAGAANIRFLPFFPASKVPSVLAAGDLHVITVKRGLEGVVVPSKLYGILAAGRPILVVASRETDAASLGARRGFGVSADPDEPEEMVAVVRTLLQEPARLQSMAAAARGAAHDYSRVNEIINFITIIEESVSR